jgi:hypothetical protein
LFHDLFDDLIGVSKALVKPLTASLSAFLKPLDDLAGQLRGHVGPGDLQGDHSPYGLDREIERFIRQEGQDVFPYPTILSLRGQ